MDKKIEEMRWNNAVTAVVSLYMKDNPQKTRKETIQIKTYDGDDNYNITKNVRNENLYDGYLKNIDELVAAMDPNNQDFDFVITDIISYEKGIIEVEDIDWEIDDYEEYNEDEDMNIDLPCIVHIYPETLTKDYGITPEDFEDEYALRDAVEEYLSNEYGFLVNGYVFTIIPENEIKNRGGVQVSERYVELFNTFIRKRK